MPFSTTSYLAGIGTVVTALTIGFSGGVFLAPHEQYVEQNRLQRVSSTATMSNQEPQIVVMPKMETAAANAASLPAPAAQQPVRHMTIPVMAKSAGPESPPVPAKTLVSPREAAETHRTKRPQADEETTRVAQARAAERKRVEAEQSAARRKQRETEVATVAGTRLIRDRTPPQFAVRNETPFGFFGED
jgi:hypothetical protein